MREVVYAPVKQCPRCFWTMAKDATACSHCGFAFLQIIQPRVLQLTAAEYALAKRAVRKKGRR